MECVIGVVGHKTDEDKIMLLDSHKLMGASGEPDDRNSVQFTEFIQKNLHLYQFRNNMLLSTANFIRGELATALRNVQIQTTLISLVLYNNGSAVGCT